MSPVFRAVSHVAFTPWKASKEIFIVILPRFMGNALVFLCIDRLLRHSISHSMFGSAILANDYFNLV